MNRKTNTTAMNQSSKKPPQMSRRLARKQGNFPGTRVVKFPQAEGRTVELVELFASDGYSCVSIRFQDKTDLSVEIDPCLAFHATFSDWKTHNQRVLKHWPTVRSKGN